MARQDLNYLAPEYIFAQGGAIGFDLAKADMFSFGCLISTVYNHLKTPFDAGDNIAMYKKCTEQVCKEIYFFSFCIYILIVKDELNQNGILNFVWFDSY